MSNNPQGWVYDLETLSNCFTGVFYNIATKEIKRFVIHNDRDDRLSFYEFLHQCVNNKDVFLGYNNIFFDGPIIDHTIDSQSQFMACSASSAATLIYNKAQNLITSNKISYNTNFYIKQLDVYKLMNYDRLFVSLKTLQGSMRWHQMQDMPIHHSKHIVKSDIDDILAYNDNDVYSTNKFYEAVKTEIDLRKTISKLYGFDAMNMSSTKIGETIFIRALEKATGKDSKQLKEDVKKNQIVDIGDDLIFPYIELKQEPFVKMREYLEKQKVTHMKGFFTEIPIGPNEKELLPFASKHKSYFNKKFNRFEKLNVVHYDNTFIVGAGGLHSTHNSQTVFKSTKDRVLVDCDFASYYPWLCIANNWYPDHLGPKFIEVYLNLYNERLKYKMLYKNDKSNIEANIIQLAIKLSLNSVYGKLGSQYSGMHNSRTQLGICINGQLTLMQSIEMVMEKSKAMGYSINLLFSNTDGFMVDIDRQFLPELEQLMQEIWDLTGIEIEHETCDAMYQNNVNNFILTKPDGVKLKGSYEIDKDFHKNGSMRIVSIAAANYFINGVDPKDTIHNHLKRNRVGKLTNEDYDIYYSKKHNKKVVNQGIYDFVVLKKTDDRFQLYEVTTKGVKTPVQKSIRYVLTTSGVKLLKETKETGRIGMLEATKKSYEQVFNKMPNCDLNDQQMISFEQSIPINYRHYIKEAQKLIYSIEGYGQQLLF